MLRCASVAAVAAAASQSIRLKRGAEAADLRMEDDFDDDDGGLAPSPSAAIGPPALAAFARTCASTFKGDYGACFFENATQVDDNGETHLLGVFRGWDGSALLFGDGDACPGPILRNATVAVHCGADALLLRDATEPTMCAYAMHLDIPVACETLAYGADDQSPPPERAELLAARADALAALAAADAGLAALDAAPGARPPGEL